MKEKLLTEEPPSTILKILALSLSYLNQVQRENGRFPVRETPVRVHITFALTLNPSPNLGEGL
ncbi:MAG: hypothetical protein OHK0047_39820 [Leptolyngbyaceae cyanobacterium]